MEDEDLNGRQNVQPDRQLLIQRDNKIKQEMVLYRNRQKHKLRKDVQFSREKINSEANNSRILLGLFPEEIWIMILQKINSTEDRMHCMKTCVLFDRLLQNWKPTLIFDKAFPKFLKYLSCSDYLNLRRVCQNWQKTIDTFFENPLINDLPTNSYCFVFWERVSPKADSCFQYDFRVLSSNKQRGISRVTHRKNPFIGRAARISISKPQYKLSRPFSTLLRKSGLWLWHLKLEYGCYLGTFENSPSLCLSTCLEFIKGFKNLRSLCLSDESHNNGDNDVVAIPEDPKLLEVPLPNHEYLESLTFDSRTKDLSKVVDKLVQKYSNQLKYLCVCSWNSELYQTQSWNSLQQLTLNISDWPTKVFQSLCKFRAPNLIKLSLEFNEDENKKLGNMLRVIKSFPSLVSLEFGFSESNNGFQNNEVLEVRKGFGFCEGIQEITVIADFKVELDFLIFFPMVKRLELTHYVDESTSTGLIDMPYWSYEVSSQEKEFSLMYKSNIWEILPHLQSLKEVRNDAFDRLQPYRIYTRLGFEAKLNQREVCDKIFQLARKEAKYQCDLKRLELIKEHKKLRQVVSTKSKKGGQKQKITSSQILEFVLPYLYKSELLLCRTICQNWRSAIDNILEGIKLPKQYSQQLVCTSVDTERSNSLQRNQIIHKFHIPTLDIEDSKISDMKRVTPLNPFVGRTVVVELNQKVKEVWSQAEQLQFKKLIETFGAHIWHLEISGSQEGAFVQKRDFYEIIILFVLQQCKNLRTLTLNNCHIYSDSSTPAEFVHSELPDHLYLQMLDLGVLDDLVRNEQILLLKKFHQQLTSLKIGNFLFNFKKWGMCWRNLTELEISSEYGTKAVNSMPLNKRRACLHQRHCFDHLFPLDAPNLRRLSLTIVGGREELTNVILLTRYFSNLNTLAFKFLKEPLNCCAEEITSMTPEFISSTKLVCMEITATENMTCYDFLHFFPYIRKLVVCEVFEVVEEYKEKGVYKPLTRPVSVKNKKLDKKTRIPDVLSIKFANYLPQTCDDHKGIGTSSTNVCKSVWEILPLLGRVEMTKKHIFSDAKVSKQKTFFRK